MPGDHALGWPQPARDPVAEGGCQAGIAKKLMARSGRATGWCPGGRFHDQPGVQLRLRGWDLLGRPLAGEGERSGRGKPPQPHMAAIRAADALVQQRRVRDLVAGGAGPAAGAVVGAAAVGKADLKAKIITPPVPGVAGVAGAGRRTARSKSNPVGYASRLSTRTAWVSVRATSRSTGTTPGTMSSGPRDQVGIRGSVGGRGAGRSKKLTVDLGRARWAPPGRPPPGPVRRRARPGSRGSRGPATRRQRPAGRVGAGPTPTHRPPRPAGHTPPSTNQKDTNEPGTT